MDPPQHMSDSVYNNCVCISIRLVTIERYVLLIAMTILVYYVGALHMHNGNIFPPCIPTSTIIHATDARHQ